MSETNPWLDVKIGSLITCFETGSSTWHDNLIVVCLGHDWAVLRKRDGSKVVGSVLEPADHFAIGEYEYQESDGSLQLRLTYPV